MALSDKAKRHIELAMVSKEIGEEVSSAIDSGSNVAAASVAEIGATADLSAASVTTGGTPDCDAAAVQDAIDAVAGEVESRLDALEAKIDELIAALKTAGLMEV